MVIQPKLSSVAYVSACLALLAGCTNHKKEVVGNVGGATGTGESGRDGAVSGGTGGATGTGGADTGGATASMGGAPGTGGTPGNGGAGIADGGAGGGEVAQRRKLDLLFMVDNSASMKPLQAKMTQRLPDFIQALKDGATGRLPDLHVAVINSSLGAGVSTDVPGCGPGVPGDSGGKFQHKDGCGLTAGETYIKARDDGSTNNFTGQIEDVFGCIAVLGDGGCGFEHTFESMRRALIQASDPTNPSVITARTSCPSIVR